MSDQDFFFDEEEEKTSSQKPAAKPAAKSGARTGGTKSSARSSAPKAASAKAVAPEGESGFLFELMTVSKGIATLAVACALLLGLAVGILVGQSRAESFSVSDVPAATSGTGSTGQSAPQLTQDQLNSGQLPAGHPSIGATGSSSATGQ